MASTKTKKKTNKTKEQQLEKDIKKIEENIEDIKKKQELEEEINQKKLSIKEALTSQLLEQGKYGKQFDDMVEDYLYLVGLKEELKYDINENGIRYKSTGGNGFTTYKPNESCERLLKVNAQMLKILQDLELKAPDEGGGDDGDLL